MTDTVACIWFCVFGKCFTGIFHISLTTTPLWTAHCDNPSIIKLSHLLGHVFHLVKCDYLSLLYCPSYLAIPSPVAHAVLSVMIWSLWVFTLTLQKAMGFYATKSDNLIISVFSHLSVCYNYDVQEVFTIISKQIV